MSLGEGGLTSVRSSEKEGDWEEERGCEFPIFRILNIQNGLNRCDSKAAGRVRAQSIEQDAQHFEGALHRTNGVNVSGVLRSRPTNV